MSDKLRAVLVGCGDISNVWLKTITTMDSVDLVALVDLDETVAEAQAVENELDEVIVDADLEAVLSHTKPDIVFDCTVPTAHANVTIEALQHGCHVLGEKPMADSMEEARRMVAAADEAGRIYAVMQNRRFDPNIRRLQAFLASGEIGTLTTINSDFYIGAHMGGFRYHMPHVLLLDMAIHTFDAARFLTGADPVSVYCKEWNPHGSWFDQ
ncbi:MAG TPA: Gfo/Idh/MocA family oxidoreductase, partial [Rhodothermales bacterium]|nr:Gfo/Idh/MocA family oxidoreductase [Rhodothermales bacterium]